MKTLAQLFYDLLTRHHLVPEIIFDELTNETWEKMQKKNTLDDTHLRKLNKALETLKPTNPRQTLQLKLLRFLTHLTEGEFYKMNHGLEANHTPLESAIILYEDLMKNIQSKPEEASELHLRIITQAIYVCCRDNNFEVAQTVAKRLDMHSMQNGNDTVEDVQLIKRSLVQWEIQEVLDSEDCHHSILETSTYSDFCKTVLQGLQFLMDSFSLQESTSGEINGTDTDETHSDDKDLLFERKIMKTLLHLDMESWCPKDTIGLWNCLDEQDSSAPYNEETVAYKVKSALERLDLLQEIRNGAKSKDKLMNI